MILAILYLFSFFYDFNKHVYHEVMISDSLVSVVDEFSGLCS